MAKSKKKIEQIIEPQEIVPEPIVEPVTKLEEETENENEVEVIGIAQAEKLQKQGWHLINVSQTSGGKKYKFRK